MVEGRSTTVIAGARTSDSLTGGVIPGSEIEEGRDGCSVAEEEAARLFW